MFRHLLFSGAVIGCGLVALIGCSKDEGPDRTVLLTEGFEGGLSHWEGTYYVGGEWIYQMRITTDAASAGTHSLTTDSNMTALVHKEMAENRVESGTAGVEFSMMAASLSQANFGVEIGQNPGSSGTIAPAFGIFFDPSDSIKCIVFCSYPAVDSQTMIAPMQAGHWYKCKIEVNMTDSTTSYYLDGSLIHTEQINSLGLMGVDVVLVYRGLYGKNYSSSSEGVKPYYVDDITFYSKP